MESMGLSWCKVWGKFIGKVFSYLGLLIGIGGVVWENLPMFILGIVTIVIGCAIHEANEK
jgi:hypothetical protein